MALHSIRLHGGDRARLATEINADEKGRRVRHDRWGLARATMTQLQLTIFRFQGHSQTIFCEKVVEIIVRRLLFVLMFFVEVRSRA